MPYVPTTWVSGSTPTDAAEMNNIETGVSGAYTELESITANDGATLPSSNGPFTLANFINYLTTLVKSIVGGAHWYSTPPASLTDLNTAVASLDTEKADLSGATFSGTVNVASGNLQRGGKNVCYAQSGLTGKRTASTTAPSSPADGDEWIDLSTVLS